MPLTVLAATLFLPPATVAQEASEQDEMRRAASEAFEATCARCHTGELRAPSPLHLSNMSARSILASLETGRMAEHAEDLSPEVRRALAEMLSGRPLSETEMPSSAFCRSDVPVAGPVSWSGWGGSPAGTGHRTATAAGMTPDDVGSLELAWAFGFPDASQARSQPAVVGDHVIVGGAFGDVYALRRDSGCIEWSFEADAAIRGAIAAAPDRDRDDRLTVYFADFLTNVYALDASGGDLQWRVQVGRHTQHNVTGTVAVHDGIVYVPISSMEVVAAGDPRYECCTSSGAIAAISARDGGEVWFHRVIADEAIEVGVTEAGTPWLAPAGAPVWSSPTVDAERGLLYVGTGENYTRPATGDSDAVLALDLETGERMWIYQGTDGDAYTMACGVQSGPNCPAPPGPDHDFGMSPLLVLGPSGRQILIAGQKSGVVHALDPDAQGAYLWSTRVGRGGALGGVHWGMSSDGRLAYAPVSDRFDGGFASEALIGPAQPGLHALDVETGEVAWYTPAPDVCAELRGCMRAFSSAPTSIDGAVFTGGLDGRIRAYASTDGALLWEFDAARDFDTVNGVLAKGGAFDGPGPVVDDGMLFVNSGYGSFGQIPGNVLLAFRVGR